MTPQELKRAFAIVAAAHGFDAKSSVFWKCVGSATVYVRLYRSSFGDGYSVMAGVCIGEGCTTHEDVALNFQADIPGCPVVNELRMLSNSIKKSKVEQAERVADWLFALLVDRFSSEMTIATELLSTDVIDRWGMWTTVDGQCWARDVLTRAL